MGQTEGAGASGVQLALVTSWKLVVVKQQLQVTNSATSVGRKRLPTLSGTIGQLRLIT